MPRMTEEQLQKHPKRDSLLGVNTKKQEPASQNVDKTEMSPARVLPEAVQVNVHEVKGLRQFAVVLDELHWGLQTYHKCHYTVPGNPVGKPRMTQRDVWKKRPAVLRYRDYCDRIRAVAHSAPIDPFAIVVIAFIAMAPSWSKKKQGEHWGMLCRQKPDYDNIAKSVGDALFGEDSILGGGTCWKFWCYEGEQRTEITVLGGYDSFGAPR